MEECSITPPVKKRGGGSNVKVPLQLLNIVQQAAGGEKEDISISIEKVKTKGMRTLDSYLSCVCMLVN
jgi:hypothetical protein